MRKTLVPATVTFALALAACGGSDGGGEADGLDTCRVAQRLVDEAASGDADGVERQIDRLADDDSVGERTDLGDLEDLASAGDQGSIDELVDVLDADLDCLVEAPAAGATSDTTGATTADTAADVTAAPSTEAPADTTADTTAATTAGTAAPDTAAPATTASAPAGGGESLAVVDIGATGPGIDLPELIESGEEALAESGITSLPVPAGEVGSIEYSLDYSVDDFADGAAYSATESIIYIAATDLTIQEVRDAFAEAIVGAVDVETTVTSGESSQDDTSTAAATVEPVDFGEGATYDVGVATTGELPGVVFVEVSTRETRDGELPPFTEAATAQLGEASDIGSGLGWTLNGWGFSPGFNQFSGESFTSADLSWSAGSGTEADVAPTAAALLEALPAAPTYEDVASDSEYYGFDDGTNWSVRFSDVFEGEELRATWNYAG